MQLIYCNNHSTVKYIQVLNQPSSEQECIAAHEPYALHKKIRSKECSLSWEILAMEEKFERLLTFSYVHVVYLVMIVDTPKKISFRLHLKERGLTALFIVLKKVLYNKADIRLVTQ